jgi:hypothetical protein
MFRENCDTKLPESAHANGDFADSWIAMDGEMGFDGGCVGNTADGDSTSEARTMADESGVGAKTGGEGVWRKVGNSDEAAIADGAASGIRGRRRE